MYLKIEPEAFEATDKSEETQIPDPLDAEDDSNDLTEMAGKDKEKFQSRKIRSSGLKLLA